MQFRSLKKRVIIDILGVLILLVALFIWSNKKSDSYIAGNSISTTYTNISFDSSDINYILSISELNVEEIEFGKLIESQTQQPSLQKLGTNAQLNFAATQLQLKHLADQAPIEILNEMNSTGRDSYEKLLTLRGTDFDTTSLSILRTINKSIEEISQDEIHITSNKELKEWAISLLSITKTQLRSINSKQYIL